MKNTINMDNLSFIITSVITEKTPLGQSEVKAYCEQDNIGLEIKISNTEIDNKDIVIGRLKDDYLRHKYNEMTDPIKPGERI